MPTHPEAPAAERAPRVPVTASSERGSVSESVCVHDRPHPGPLPHPPSLRFGAMQERENHPAVAGEFGRAQFPVRSEVNSKRGGDSTRAIQPSRAVRQLSPLPGGEGQGEGERLHIIFPVCSEAMSKEAAIAREPNEIPESTDSRPLSPGRGRILRRPR